MPERATSDRELGEVPFGKRVVVLCRGHAHREEQQDPDVQGAAGVLRQRTPLVLGKAKQRGGAHGVRPARQPRTPSDRRGNDLRSILVKNPRRGNPTATIVRRFRTTLFGSFGLLPSAI